MTAAKQIFLRNDDVRDRLDRELVDLTDLCIKYNVPISHAVEPANVTHDVVNWLMDVKKQNPGLIEIIQHGYDHNRKHPEEKMEFGGNRSYQDQLDTIRKGKDLMDKYFGDHWDAVFTFPYGSYNTNTLKAIDKLGYLAISSKINYSFKNQIKNKLGNLLDRDFLLEKKISYHNKYRKHYGFKEISVSANLIKKYIDVNDADHYTKSNILAQIDQSFRFSSVVGILFHHRFHGNHINMIEELFIELKESYTFSTIMNLVRLS